MSDKPKRPPPPVVGRAEIEFRDVTDRLMLRQGVAEFEGDGWSGTMDLGMNGHLWFTVRRNDDDESTEAAARTTYAVGLQSLVEAFLETLKANGKHPEDA